MDFRDVPIEDINYLLSYHGQLPSDNLYLQAWNFIMSNENILVPKSISDWINLYYIKNNFQYLPNEVIAKIFSGFEYDVLEKVCTIDRRFNNICDEYIAPSIKKLITDDLINVDGINSTIQLINIYKTIKINKRIIKFPSPQFASNERYAIVRKDGKILIKNISSKIDIDEDDAQYEYTNCILKGINNAISLSNLDKKFVVYTSSRDVYICSPLDEDDLCSYIPKKIGLKNIIQISGIKELYYLDFDGYVYNENYDVILKDVISMTSNNDSTIFLNKNGNIFGIGDNTNGVLGFGFVKNVYVPSKIKLENVKSVHITKYFTYALTNDDKLYVFGYGLNLVKIGRYNYKLPTLIDSPKNIKKIVSGTSDITILTYDGYIYVMSNPISLKKILHQNL